MDRCHLSYGTNTEAPTQAVEEIDEDLIRYAIATLRSHLQEAAILDTGRLIAERVLDTSEKQESLTCWEAWLSAAPCWPALARENWPEAVRQAAQLVVEEMIKAGITLDSKAEAALAEQVGKLEIEDLLPKSTFERLFPPKQEARGW